MVTGREAAAAANAVVSVANTLQQLGNNYYASTAAWKEFPRQVAILQDRHNALSTQLERYGHEVGQVLREAKKVLLKEVKKLEKRTEKKVRKRRKKRRNRDTPEETSEETDSSGSSGKAWSCASLAMRRIREIAFPKKIGLAVGDAIRAYDSIGEHLRKQKEDVEHIQFLASQSPMSLPFGTDISNLYVSLEQTESDISSAIEQVDAGSPNVILLYGGPGTGKSTVSTQISLKYTSLTAFDHVVWLECGPRVDTEVLELKLLQYLGWSNDFSQNPEKRLEDAHLQGTRRSRLQKLLSIRKVLIVMDDLQQSLILQELLTLSGLGVKYLVTSQQDDICDNINCKLICFEIQNLHSPDATEICQKMLALHIGYPSGHIPHHLQEMADGITEHAEGVPLVISTLGAQLAKADHNNPAVWKYLLDHPYEFLTDGKPSKYIHGIPYLKSYWSALQQSIDGLGTEEKQLLLLLGMCKDASVPEAVVFFMFGSICSEEKGNILHFSTMKRELKSRQLVSEKSQSHLEIHSLTKRFLVEQRKETAELMAESVIAQLSRMEQAPNSSACIRKVTILRVLICLYLDASFVSPIADHMLLGQSHATFSDIKKTVTEPITLQLLALDVSWTEEFHQAACQVFLDFFCDDTLCNAQLSRLLLSPTWVSSTLKFLQNSSALDESFWGKNTIHGILHSFEKIVRDIHYPHTQMQASQALEGLICRRANWESILGAPALLHQLVNLITQSLNPEVQCSGAKFFASCSYSIVNEPLLLQLLCFPPFLPSQINSLADDQNPPLQSIAARTLINLTATIPTPARLQIINSLPLLQSFVTLLTKYSRPKLQSDAAWAIANLAGPRANHGITKQIASQPGLFDGLEMGLDQDDNKLFQVWSAAALIRLPWTKDTSKLLQILATALEVEEDPYLQEMAATCLAYSAAMGDTMRSQILNFPRLLETLIKALENHVNPGLQTQAAGALVDLVESSNCFIHAKVLDSPLLLGNWVASLKNQSNPQLQVNVAWGIAKLAGRGATQAMREQIARHPGLLDVLEMGLDQDDNKRFQVWSATALTRLAWTKDTSKLLQILATALEVQEDPWLQEVAATCLAYSAAMGDTMRSQILDFPRLWETLIKALDNHVNLDLQTMAAGALVAVLASSNCSIHAKVLDSLLLLGTWVASLNNQSKYQLQVNVAWGIANLAGQGATQAMKEQIARHPGLLDGLEMGLDQDDNKLFQVWSARALIRLAWTKDTSKLLQILATALEVQEDPYLQEMAATCLAYSAAMGDTTRSQILNFPRLLETLIKALDNHVNPGLQTQVAHALANLVASSNCFIHAKVLDSPLLLGTWVASLNNQSNPQLQVNVAGGIAYLAGQGATQAMREQIARHPGLLDGLEMGLDQDYNKLFQVWSARALIRLAWTKDTSKLLQILATALEVQEDPYLQKMAAACLADYAAMGDTMRSQILNFPTLLETLRH